MKTSRRAPSSRRLTLVELLVAVALSVVLVGVMTFVWTRSSDVFAVQTHRIETYQRVRNILDTIERDLANTQLTGDMEFFTDANGNGFYEEGVDAPFPSAYDVPGGTPDPRGMRAPGDPADPLVRLGEPEFAALPPGHALNVGAGFMRGPTIFSPTPYRISEAEGYLENRAFWRDEIYVRSFMTVGDRNRPALVHYRLVQPVVGGRSALRRRVWHVDARGDMTPETDTVDVRAVDVCDLKVGFMFKRSPIGGNSVLYHGATSNPADFGASDSPEVKLLERDLARGFKSTYSGAEPLSDQHTPDAATNPDASLMTRFVYEGCARLEEPEVGEVALRTLRGDVQDDLSQPQFTLGSTADLAQYSNFGFDGVRPGGRVLLFDATDDDAAQVGSGMRSAGARFPARLYTVDSVSAESATSIGGSSILSLRFLERVPFGTLRRTWLGNETEVRVTDSDVGTHPESGPPRVIKASFNVHYRVGFLPSAFVVRLSVDDRYNQKVLPMERVIRLLQQ